MKPTTMVLAMCVAGGLSLGSEPVSAQSADTVRITLRDALSIAQGSNPAYRQTNNNLGLNGLEMQTTWLDQIIPRASVSLFNTGFTGNLQRIARDNFGNPIDNPTADWVYFSSTDQSLSLNWNFQGQSLLHSYRRQALTNEGRGIAERRALTGLQIAVQRSYVDAMEQRELLDAESELLEARRIDQNVSERLFSLALRTRVDVLNAELAVEQQTLQLQRQQAAYDRALLAVRTQLGDDGLGAIDLVDEPLPIFDPSGLDPDRLVEMAVRVNPELEQSRLAMRTARLGVSEQKNQWWPAVDMGLAVYRRSQLPKAQSLFDVNIDNGLESQFSLRFSIPMFNDFFGNRQRSAQARVQMDNDREAEREARLRVEETIRGAWLGLRSEWEALRLTERSAEIATEALRLAREEYRIGSRSFEDLRSAFNEEANTRRQVITSRHGFVDALLALEEAVGDQVRPPAAGANPESAAGR